MADGTLRLGNALVLGEFCEVHGPVVRLLLFQHPVYGHPEILNSNQWSATLTEMLEELMTLSICGDYTIKEGSTDTVTTHVMRFVLDNIRWDSTTAFAHVARINLPDAFARGQQRAVCVIFVNLSPHISMSLSRWIGDCCEMILHRLAHGAQLCVYNDIQRCKKAYALLSVASESEGLLPQETLNLLQHELQVLMCMNRHGETSLQALSQTHCNSIEMTSIEAIHIAHDLVTRRGTVPLRPLSFVCGTHYDESLMDMKRLLLYFSLDMTWMMEGALGRMPSIFSIFHSSFAEAEKHNIKKENAISPLEFVFNVGEWGVLRPLLPTDACGGFLPHTWTPPGTDFTAINDRKLYSVLKGYGAQHIVNVAYNGLRCKRIIVCGYDECAVVHAMKVACLFIPGLLQCGEDTLRLGIQPLSSEEPISASDLHHFAVVGCHVNAAIRNNEPFFPQHCTWYVRYKANDIYRYRTVNVFGEPYNSHLYNRPNRRQPFSLSLQSSRSSPFSSSSSSSLLMSPPPTGQSLPSSSTVPIVEDGRTGVLAELLSVLRQKASTSEDEVVFSDHIRVVLKHLQFEYCSLASLVLHSLLSRSCRHGLVDTLQQDNKNKNTLPYFSSRTLVVPEYTCPYVWTEEDTEEVLHTLFGVTIATRSDLTIVTEIVKRMSIITAQQCSSSMPKEV
ncbi:uncharacterized protein TM35_000411070 [Trypanosoma theileri]|uniref:Uncharacterized protein n=1 Tax=Trypanosoma theileri TaxID=67003 RepID=A0A1X0NJC3_9TRYP|nr:uncharacterized protein TM35_000411070 [Trypanosoma theileri]ORC84737.1 hypothetical protein TM35_000411070 [Trypanosoma theileri]